MRITISLFLLFISVGLLAEESDSGKHPETPRSREAEDYKDIPDAELRTRIDHLQGVFDETSAHSRIWYHGWIGVYGISALASAAQAGTTEMPASRRKEILTAYMVGVDPRFVAFIAASAANTQRISDSAQVASYAMGGRDGIILTSTMRESFSRAEKIRHAKQSAIVNAWTSALAFGATLATPYPAAYASRDFREMAGSSSMDLRMKIARGESWLEQSAESEAFGRSALSHFLNFAVAAASGLALTSGYGRSSHDGWAMFGSNLLVGEIAIFTQPTHSTSSWKTYRAKFFPGDQAALAADVNEPLQIRGWSSHLADSQFHWHFDVREQIPGFVRLK
ncbi:MAG: hypothetical protein JNM27_03735 [Leptospirales bacterium]|nr:hypothetical protein [Leptospirales bacterium]